VSGVTGIWLELGSDPPGTITGISLASLAVATPIGGETLASYRIKASGAFQSTFCNRAFSLAQVPATDPNYITPPPGCFIDAANGNRFTAKIVDIDVTFSSLSPLVVESLTVKDGAYREVSVN
jgi:hypothetical protein